ncbi:mCG1033956 [Mus musculus]|nr:mCG1033956 [Mus musculus]
MWSPADHRSVWMSSQHTRAYKAKVWTCSNIQLCDKISDLVSVSMFPK